ncbi:MAG: substrate-binding domain-containing protein, partial [Clostridia bacterium]|nr:substrate-binding domain-containing protein [Clostridia bacterium]
MGCESIYTFTFDRKTGYQLSLMQNGITADPDYCLEMDSLLSDGSEKLHALLSRKDRPTAFVVSDDILAVSLKRACAQLGLSVPEDVSIVAFN